GAVAVAAVDRVAEEALQREREEHLEEARPGEAPDGAALDGGEEAVLLAGGERGEAPAGGEAVGVRGARRLQRPQRADRRGGELRVDVVEDAGVAGAGVAVPGQDALAGGVEGGPLRRRQHPGAAGVALGDLAAVLRRGGARCALGRPPVLAAGRGG